MTAFSFAFITFAMLASQSASTRSREDQLMLKPHDRFLELHQFHVCSNFPHTFVGIAMGKIWKNENKGIDVFCFFILFDVEGECSGAQGLLTCKQYGRELGKKTGFQYMCWLSGDSCSAHTIRKVVEIINPGGVDDLYGFSELHLFMLAPISPRPLLVLPWENLKQKDCCFLLLMLFDVLQGLCNRAVGGKKNCDDLSKKVEKASVFRCEWSDGKCKPNSKFGANNRR